MSNDKVPGSVGKRRPVITFYRNFSLQIHHDPPQQTEEALEPERQHRLPGNRNWRTKETRKVGGTEVSCGE